HWCFRINARIVHQPIEATADLGHPFNGDIDVLRFGHVQAHGPNVRYRAKCLEIGFLTGTRIDEISMRRESLGDLAADARAGPGDENGFLFLIRWIRGVTDDRQCGEQHERDENRATHGAPWIAQYGNTRESEWHMGLRRQTDYAKACLLHQY